MNSKRFLIQFQYLGFRFHGVQVQPGLPSIHSRIHKCLVKLFQENSFSLRFASRTDALVSAEQSYFLVMFNDEQSIELLSQALHSLPPDIQILSIKSVHERFILLNQIESKVYHYYFAHSLITHHAYAAPFMTILKEELDMNLIKEAAKRFEGTHDFSNYCYRPRVSTQFIRTINQCKIDINDSLKASFFPETTYKLIVESKGFMRGQVRLMVGAIFRVGRKQMSLDELDQSLTEINPKFVKWMVPSSGLVLHKTILRE